MTPAQKAIRFLETLTIPEGPTAGRPVKLAPFQRQFVKGALAKGIKTGVPSIGRGNAKKALSAGLAFGARAPFDPHMAGYSLQHLLCGPEWRAGRSATATTDLKTFEIQDERSFL
jgi:hypothetical protein